METATIRLTFDDTHIAQHVLKAIEPDNYPLPEGIQIQSRVDECTLITEITSQKGLDSLRHTIEDLMNAIDLSIRTIKSIQ